MANDFNMMEIISCIQSEKVNRIPFFTEQKKKLSVKELEKMLDQYTYIPDYTKTDEPHLFKKLNKTNRRTVEIIKQIEMASELIEYSTRIDYNVINDNPDKEQDLFVTITMLGFVSYNCWIRITYSDLHYDYIYKLRFTTKLRDKGFKNIAWINFGIKNQSLLTVLFSPFLSNEAEKRLFNKYMNYPKYKFPIEGNPIDIAIPDSIISPCKEDYDETQFNENVKKYINSLDKEIKLYCNEFQQIKCRHISVPDIDSVIYYIEDNSRSTVFAAILLFNDPRLNENTVLKNDKFNEILKIFRQQLFDEHSECNTLKPVIARSMRNIDMVINNYGRNAHFIARILQCLANNKNIF